MEKKADYIIVGQGLAGTCLAVVLMRRSRRVVIIDPNEAVTSSRVAAGLYNPVTGRKMVKTWMADRLFPYLTDFYTDLEELTGAKFLNTTGIYRPFISLEEQNEWMGKSASEEFRQYIRKVHCQSRSERINDPFGGLELAQAGYLKVATFLGAMHDHFRAREMLRAGNFVFDRLIIHQNTVEYEGITAKRIIFCDGSSWEHNTYFNWLPFRPVKGEVLEIKCDLEVNFIVNRGVFCVPLSKNMFRVGSNYDNNDHSWTPTERAKAEIEEKLRALINVPFETVYQKAGVRPSSKDRRPYIGLHPANEALGVFNGLGTKGVSLAPFFGEHFACYLEDGKELYKEVNISRYFSLYYNSQK